MGCGVGTLSFLTQLFALVFVVGGLVVFGGGIWVMVELSNKGLKELFPVMLPIGIIVLGAVVALFSGIVCCAARRKSPFLLCFSGLFIFAVFVAQLGVGIALYVIYDNASTDLTNAWNKVDPDVQDKIQKAFNCQGWTSTGSSTTTIAPTTTTDTAATTIAAFAATTTAADGTLPTCSHKVTKFFEENLFWVATAAMILAALELFAIFSVCCMRRAIKKHRKHRDEYQHIH